MKQLKMNAYSKQQGFSLIELMITLAIVGMLAAVGNSSYQSQIKKGIRADAARTISEVMAKQEQYMMANGTYATNISQLNMTFPKTVTDNYNVYTYSYSYSTGESIYYAYTYQKPNSQIYDPTYPYLIAYSYGYKYPEKFWN